MKLPYTCKICNLPGVVTVADNADDETVTRLFPMVVHNKCFDRVADFQKAGDELVRASVILSYAGKQEAAKLRGPIPALARRYCEAFSTFHNTPLVFSESFPEMILEKPEAIGKILAEYRKRVLAMPESQPQFAEQEQSL